MVNKYTNYQYEVLDIFFFNFGILKSNTIVSRKAKFHNEQELNNKKLKCYHCINK